MHLYIITLHGAGLFVAHLAYSRFQVTFHCKIPNFVAKFGSSLRSSKVHFRIRKPVCKLSIWLAISHELNKHKMCRNHALLRNLRLLSNVKNNYYCQAFWVRWSRITRNCCNFTGRFATSANFTLWQLTYSKSTCIAIARDIYSRTTEVFGCVFHPTNFNGRFCYISEISLTIDSRQVHVLA